MRLSKEQLLDLEKKYNVNRLYSWSRVKSFMTSPYEYYLTYILNKKPDLPETSYTSFGNGCHNLLEKLYSGELDNNDFYSAFIEMWDNKLLTEKLNFCRDSDIRNNSIANKYRENLDHFFKNHKKIFSNIEVEKFLCAKLGDFVFQGYADAVARDDLGNYIIIDWKTSSIYSKKDLVKNSGQLIFYAIALNQSGIPLDKIKIAFAFLKYCDITYEKERRGKLCEAHSIIERSKIGEYSGIKQIDDCFIFVELNQESIDDVKHFLINGAMKIEEAEKKYRETCDESIFYDSDESISANYYYFSNLCGYSRKLHKPLDAYYNKRGVFN